MVAQYVDVPVQVARTPPPEVLGCWAALPPAPVFKDAPGGPLLLTDEAAQRRCDDAWRAWATAQ